MQRSIEETGRRRELQMEYNREHGITPTTVTKSVDQVRFITRVADARTTEREEKRVDEPARGYAVMDAEALERVLEQQMREAATAMDFELAAQLRDQLFELRARGTTSVKKPQAAVSGSRTGR